MGGNGREPGGSRSPRAASRNNPGVKRAVLLDALGTILWLEPPWEHADPEAFAGIDPDKVREGFVAEMTYYMERTDEGGDPEALADLRRRCAGILSGVVEREISVETMMAAIRFQPFPETAKALRGLREEGLTLVCLSNWDCSLPEVLAALELVSSASSGARKPDPAIFRAGLEAAGVTAEEALHVGDSDDDVKGAEAAGIDVLRIDRGGAGEITSLEQISHHLGPR
jgi:HAD superfamily hydrolase (TIGR01509 family)